MRTITRPFLHPVLFVAAEAASALTVHLQMQRDGYRADLS